MTIVLQRIANNSLGEKFLEELNCLVPLNKQPIAYIINNYKGNYKTPQPINTKDLVAIKTAIFIQRYNNLNYMSSISSYSNALIQGSNILFCPSVLISIFHHRGGSYYLIDQLLHYYTN